MAAWVDFDQIKAQISIEQIFERYNLLESMTRKGNKLTAICPFHKNSTPSFKATIDKNIWHCFGCNAGGDVIDFVRYSEGLTSDNRDSGRRKAALKIQEWFGLKSGHSPEKPKRESAEHADEKTPPPPLAAQENFELVKEEPAEPLVNQPLKFELKNLDATHPYLKERGLTDETIATFGLGYFTGKRGVMAGRICIPIHNNETGELIAYAGRWPGNQGWPEGEGKYKVPVGFHKSLVLFNLHRAREHAAGDLIVVEGFFDCMDLWTRDRKNVVALMGSTMSEAQERLIVETVGAKGRVLLALDADEAGRKGSADAVGRLVSRVFVREMAL